MVSDWHRYFADAVISGDPGEIDAATRAAMSALASGGSGAQARAAGKAAARQYREGRAPAASRTDERAGRWHVPQTGDRGDDWPALFAEPLFRPPVRWGWQAADVADSAPPMPPPLKLGPKPVWVDAPHPDTSELSGRRAKAVHKAVVRGTLAVLLFLAFGVYQVTIEGTVSQYGGFQGMQVYGYALPAAGILLSLWVVSALNEIRRTTADLARFRRPYLDARAAEKERHTHALREWEEAKRRHEEQVRAARQGFLRQHDGPQWYPVHPASEPTRVDVIGGDPARYGWACLLVLFGTSLLARGHRLTVLDLTGQEVGGELVRLAAARGMDTRWAALADGSDFDVFAGHSTREIGDGLAYVLTDRPDASGRTGGGEQLQERALAVDVLRTVLTALDHPVTFARLAAGLRVLRRGMDTELLAPQEIERV